MEQTNGDWQRREELLDRLLELPANERAAFIENLAEGSVQDAAALRGWLAGIERSDDYLTPNRPVAAIGRGEQRVGNWRVSSLIGRGGMGEVWLGERADGLFEKKVAIKFIRDDRPQLRSSIESERRMLAGLQHPGIVRLLDAGATADGHPFLVTDFIDGMTLDVWLERQRPALAQRLDLFRQIADAVAYAHDHLVIHRDIKPANILVDKDAHAHLLDFGIARALANDADAAQTANLALTPEFAAPELIVDNSASVRSDIYALGGLLYFLLCGKPPLALRGLALAATVEKIRHEQPPHPSAEAAEALFPGESRRLIADLDAIALQALAKAPRERYASVEALLHDIEAARASRPIDARAPDAWDRTLRYLRRHRIAIAVAAIVVLSLLAGMAGTLWQAHHARLQSDRAELEAARATAEAKNANAVSDFLVNVFKSANPEETLGKPPTAVALIDAGVRRVEVELPQQPQLQTQLLDTLGLTYQGLGQSEQAFATLRRAHAIAVETQGENSPLAMKIAVDFASVATSRAKDDLHYGEVAPLLEKIIAQDIGATRPALLVAALDQYGLMQEARGDLAGGEASLRRAVDLGRSAAPAAAAELAEALDSLHIVLIQKGHVLDAIAALEEALAIRLRLFNPHSPLVAASQQNLATALSEDGRIDAAAQMLVNAVDTYRDIYGETHPEYASGLIALARLRIEQGRDADAEALLLQALSIAKKSLGADNSIALTALNSLAVAKGHQHELGQAIDYARQAIGVSTKLYGADQASTLTLRQNLAGMYADNGDYAQAEAQSREVLAASRRNGSDNLVAPLFWLGHARRMQGDPVAAQRLHSEALASAQALRGDGSIAVFKVHAALAEDERDLETFDRARRDAEIARDGYLKLQHDPETTQARNVRYLLAQLDVLQGRCVASSNDELDAIWQRRKQMKDTPMSRWQAAEAGMFVGLCRQQMRATDSAATQISMADNAKILHDSVLAEPYIKRLAQTLVRSNQATPR